MPISDVCWAQKTKQKKTKKIWKYERQKEPRKKSKLSECLKNKNRAGDIKDADFGRLPGAKKKQKKTKKDLKLWKTKKTEKKNPSFQSVKKKDTAGTRTRTLGLEA